MANDTITNNKVLTTLAISFLVFGVLGTSVASAAHFGERRANLTDEEREVLEEIRGLVREGEIDDARDVLDDADLRDELTERVEAKLDRAENRAAIKEALENDDYDTFVELTEDAPFADLVDEDFFEALQEAHELREEGDYQGARAVLEEAGIEKFGKKARGHGPRSN